MMIFRVAARGTGVRHALLCLGIALPCYVDIQLMRISASAADLGALIAWSIEVMLVGEFAAASSLFSNTETCPHFTLSSNASWPIG
jgi:hypothetical protein